jgi:hypothetical protein
MHLSTASRQSASPAESPGINRENHCGRASCRHCPSGQARRAGGRDPASEKRTAQLRADLVHLDPTLRLFDPKAEPGIIPARRPYRRRSWFSDGELPRRILDTLRTSSEPLSASAVTANVMTAKGMDTSDAATLLMIRKGVQSYLRRQSGALVHPAGRKDRDSLWRVAG